MEVICLLQLLLINIYNIDIKGYTLRRSVYLYDKIQFHQIPLAFG